MKNIYTIHYTFVLHITFLTQLDVSDKYRVEKANIKISIETEKHASENKQTSVTEPVC